MKNKFAFTLGLLIIVFINGCIKQNGISHNNEKNIKYNIIKPGNGIYEVVKKDVNKNNLKNKAYEKKYYKEKKLIKIERYDKTGKLTDNFSVPAITKFEYDNDNHIKFIKYFDKNNNKSTDELFGYWSIEYIYDGKERVVMEIYRNAKSDFLEIPRDMNGEIAKKDFLAPVLTYEYLENNLRIKALDKNFNLLKEVIGDKPCVPFIDCGENE